MIAALRQYGIKSAVLRIGTTTARGYDRMALADAWARYLTPLPPDNSVTSVTDVTALKHGYAPQSGVVDDVTPVTHVTHSAGHRGDRTCAQCGGEDDGKLSGHRHGNAIVLLHPECVRFWKATASAHKRGGTP